MRIKQGWTIPKAIYAAIMMFLLLSYFYVMATNSHAWISGRSFIFPSFFWILRIISAVMAIMLGKLWKDKGFRILAVFLLLQVIRVVLDQYWHLFVDYVSENMLTGLWAICACYGLAAVLGKRQLKQFLTIFACIWTAGMVVSSCLGIIATWTGKPIYTIGRGSYWGLLYDSGFWRLFLTYYMTTSGSLASISTMIALCGAYTARRKWAKILFVLAALPMYVALCLTDSRCAHMSVSAGIALMAGILAMRWLRKKERPGHKMKTVLPAAAVTAAVFVGMVLISMQTINVFNGLKSEGLVSRAYAETVEQAAAQVSNRGYTGQNVLTGRTKIWEATIQVMLNQPIKFLIGNSVCDPMLGVNEINPLGFSIGHCHNMLLMVLNENGIPGLLLILSLIVMALRRCWQLVVRDGATAWITPLVAVLGSVMVGELVECFTWFRAGDNATMALFFITIGIILYRDNEEVRGDNISLSQGNIAPE